MIKPNQLIIKVICASFFVYAGWGLMAPIFALYVMREIVGGSLGMVGLAVGLHWIVKSSVQPFLAYRIDVVKGERDDMSFLLYGAIIATIIPLLYIFVTQIWQVFLLEAIRGVGLALVVPPLDGIITRHVDKDWEAYTWSLHSTGIGFSAGLSAIFGGVIASFLGFKVLFILVAIISFISIVITYATIKNDPWIKKEREELKI
jgi:predicted MFS family arabinose efflux permease